MNQDLVSILRMRIGQVLTADIAADIMTIAAQMPTLVSFNIIDQIKPETYCGLIFDIERIENITEEIKPLHRAHWDETETHSHGLPFNPDYQTFIRHERAGRYVLFTLRKEGELLGNCAMYLNRSTHTQTLLATEDTLFLLPAARRGRSAFKFVDYIERSLQQMGVREITISVKLVNKAGKFFQASGYRHVENGLSKILEK